MSENLWESSRSLCTYWSPESVKKSSNNEFLALKHPKYFLNVIVGAKCKSADTKNGAYFFLDVISEGKKCGSAHSMTQDV